MTEAEIQAIFMPGVIFRSYLAKNRHIEFPAEIIFRRDLNHIGNTQCFYSSVRYTAFSCDKNF